MCRMMQTGDVNVKTWRRRPIVSTLVLTDQLSLKQRYNNVLLRMSVAIVPSTIPKLLFKHRPDVRISVFTNFVNVAV